MPRRSPQSKRESQVARLREELQTAKREAIRQREQIDTLARELERATSRLSDLRAMHEGEEVYRHVFVGDAAHSVATVALELGVRFVRVEPNGVLVEER